MSKRGVKVKGKSWSIQLAGLLALLMFGLLYLRPLQAASYQLVSGTRRVDISFNKLVGVLGKQATLSGKVVIKTSEDMNLEAPQVKLFWDASGKRLARMEASGGTTTTGRGMNVTSQNATAYFNAAGDVERMEATGAVNFDGNRISQDGTKSSVTGECDRLDYRPAESKVSAYAKDPTGKTNPAHAHLVNTIPAKPARDSNPATEASTQDYEVVGGHFDYDLKTQEVLAEGDQAKITSVFPQKETKNKPNK
jgi:hypothetical protein